MRFLAPALISAVLVVPATAGASTGIGEISGTPGNCGNANSLYWQHIASAPIYGLPAGVITSWSTNPGADGGSPERLVVIRDGGLSNTLVGASSYETIPAGVETQFPTRIAVESGDVIGLESTDSNWPCAFSTADTGARVYMIADPSPATTFGAGTEAGSGTDLHVNATAHIEPDADHDQFGDETQDLCPSDPSTQGACTADLSITAGASAGVLNIGDTVNFTLQVKNNSGGVTAHGINVQDSLPGHFTFLSASGGNCRSGSLTINCGLGPLIPGATQTITVAARAKTPGDSFNSATIRSVTPDPNAANDSASVRVRITAPVFAGASVAAGVIRVRRGVGSMLASCPPDAVTTCAGTVVISTARKMAVPSKKRARKRILRLGKGVLSVRPGGTGTVQIPITKLGLKLLAKRGSVAAVAVINSHDSVSPNKKLTFNVLVKGKRVKRRQR